MKFDDAVNEEIKHLIYIADQLGRFSDEREDLSEEEKIKHLNSEIAHLKRIIWDEEADTAKKAMAFRLYDSLGFVKEGLKK